MVSPSSETVRLVTVHAPESYEALWVLHRPPAKKIRDADRRRFKVLALLVFIPFGGHFFKAAQSALQPYLMASDHIEIDATRYGTMLSLFALPNLVIPLLGGRCLDGRGGRWATVSFLIISLAGMATYGLGLGTFRSVAVAALGSIIFGIGEGCVVIAPRAIVSTAFLGREMAFAQGVLVAGGNLAGMLAKASVPVLVEKFGQRYEAALVGCCSMQLISLAAGVAHAVACFVQEEDEKVLASPARCSPPSPGRLPLVEADAGDAGANDAIDGAVAVRVVEDDDPCSGEAKSGSTLRVLRRLPAAFWVVSVLHALYVVVFKAFDNFSNLFLIERFGADPVTAGCMSSLTKLFALLAPVIGLMADCHGGARPVAFGASLLGVASLGALAFTSWNPVVGMLGVSLAHAFLPTLLLAIVPATVPRHHFGIAFGVSEVLVAMGNVTSNPLIGYVRDSTGNYAVSVSILFGLSLVGAVIIAAVAAHPLPPPPSDDRPPSRDVPSPLLRGRCGIATGFRC